jgi:SNF2 family DNA or RNA helicase
MPVSLEGFCSLLIQKQTTLRSRVQPVMIPRNPVSLPCINFVAAGFGLVLRDYQARTLSWLYEVDSKNTERFLSFTCLKSDSHEFVEQAGVPPLFRLVLDEPSGDDSIFYSLVDCKFFASPITRKEEYIRYRVPVNGVALCDNPGSGKTIVSLALIHSKPFVSVDDLGFDVTSFVPSRATLIICPLHLATQWQSEALRCMPFASVVILQVSTVI